MYRFARIKQIIYLSVDLALLTFPQQWSAVVAHLHSHNNRKFPTKGSLTEKGEGIGMYKVDTTVLLTPTGRMTSNE